MDEVKDKPFKKFSLVVDKELYEQINNLAKGSGRKVADVSRDLLRKGLATQYSDESSSLIAAITREQLEIVLKPHIERLAKLSSKTGHMAATAAFLNVQALMDLVPKENRKNVREMYESARKKAVEYMKTKTEDWENDF